MQCAFLCILSLVIIAEDVSGEALNTLILNKLKIGLQIIAKLWALVPVNKNPLKYIAIATSGSVFGEEMLTLNLDGAQAYDLGRVGEVIVTKNEGVLLKGKGNRLKLKNILKKLVINPSTVKVINPSTVKVNNPSTVKVINPSTVKVNNPSTVKVINPSTVKVNNPSTVKVINPSTVKVINPSTVKVINPV
ncbi:hypothetical protein MC885_008865, partial [Smutsia gigantea]